MIVDELVLKLKADIDDVKKQLGDIEKKSEEAGKKSGKAFGKGFSDAEKELQNLHNEIRKLTLPNEIEKAKKKLDE
jgi:predicted  nucleic acid-binding Zn-ribbon protein